MSLLIFWRLIANSLPPVLKPYLNHRCNKGKEIKERLPERMGYHSLPRPSGSLIHIHAASVGEVISTFPIITEIHQIDPNQHFLITTGTVTSYHIVQKKFANHPELSNRVQHQFIPLDVPKWVENFVSYWHPSLSIMVESELWPNLIHTISEHHIPLVLLNARLSDRSFKTWSRFQKTAQSLLSKFDWIAARSEHDQQNFIRLGVNADFLGDIKQIAPELSYDVRALQYLQERFTNYPIWLAASTHQTEEAIIAKAHQQLRQKYPTLITIIVPRHPERAKEIIEQIGHIPQRSLNQFPDDDNGLWLCDTLGELGLFYRLCDIIFIGNSLDSTPKGGGHNPFEPAKLGCAIASGDKIHNFIQAYALLDKAITITPDLNTLISWVDRMLSDSNKRQYYMNQSLQIMNQQSELAHHIASHLYSLKA